MVGAGSLSGCMVETQDLDLSGFPEDARLVTCPDGKKLVVENVTGLGTLSSVETVSAEFANNPHEPGNPGTCIFECSCIYEIDAECSDGSEPVGVDGRMGVIGPEPAFAEYETSGDQAYCDTLAGQDGGIADVQCTIACAEDYTNFERNLLCCLPDGSTGTDTDTEGSSSAAESSSSSDSSGTG